MNGRFTFSVLALVLLLLAIVVPVAAEVPACNTHPLHAESPYTLQAPWGQADGSDPRTWDVYFDHDQYETVPKEELGSGSFFACPHLRQKQTCCGYSTYMHMKKQVVQMYEIFFNETLSDLREYTKKFDDMVNEFIDTLKTALQIADNSFDVDTKGANEIISYVAMFISRIWSVSYESTGNAQRCIANWMVYYASMWCLSCDQEDFNTYIKGGTLQLNKKDLKDVLGEPCGSPIVSPLMTLVADFAEMIMKLIDPNSWWYSTLDKASGILESSIKDLANNIVGGLIADGLADNMNGADLSYLVKRQGSAFSLEAFGPLSVGAFLYDIMAWVDEYLFGWVPQSVKRQANFDVRSASLSDEAAAKMAELNTNTWSYLDNHPLNYIKPHPQFENAPFAGTKTILYNTVVDYASKHQDEAYLADPKVQSNLDLCDEWIRQAGIDAVTFQNDMDERVAFVQGVKADGAPDVSVAAVESGGYEFYPIGLKTNYFPEIQAYDDENGPGGIKTNITNPNNSMNNQQSTFSGTEYLAAAAVTLMIMGSCAQGKRSAAKAAAKNLKKKRSGKAKSGMDRLLEERKKTKLSTEAKHNLLAIPSTSQFDAFLERTGGSVGKHNKVELISEELRRPTGRAQSGPPRPSEGSKERLDHMNRVIEQQKVVKKVRSF